MNVCSGVFAPPISQKTTEGYDLQFGTNVLGHYLLTILLLPTMIHTAKHSPCAGTYLFWVSLRLCLIRALGGFARVINVSSIMHLFAPAGGINYASLASHCEVADKLRASLGPERLYAQSKWVRKQLGLSFN